MKFQQIVFSDADLQARLRAISDRGEFIEKVIELAKERDLEFTAEDVLGVLQASRRAWIERWLG